MLTEEEKKGLELSKEDRQNLDLDQSMNALAKQFTDLYGDLHKNRENVQGLFSEVEGFHDAQTKELRQETKEWGSLGGRRLQAVQNNMLLDAGHSAY